MTDLTGYTLRKDQYTFECIVAWKSQVGWCSFEADEFVRPERVFHM